MRTLFTIFAAALLTTPAWADPHRDEARGRHHHHEHRFDADHEHAPPIPRGHLPPSGLCRVWYPDAPPGHQPPPQSCGSAFRDAPRGAWVVEQRHDVTLVHTARPRPRPRPHHP